MERYQWLIDSDMQFKLVGRLLSCVVRRGDEHLIQKMLEEELSVPFMKLRNIENSEHLMIHNNDKDEPMFRYETYSKNREYLVKIGFESDKITRVIGYKRTYESGKKDGLGRRTKKS